VTVEFLRLRTDGGARGNPGPAGLGMLLEARDGTRLWAGYSYAGVMTNNRAEYLALIAGLRKALEFAPPELEVCMDSELVVHQMNGRYRIRNADLKPLAIEAQELLARFRRVTLRHVPRSENAGADALANRAMDEHRKKTTNS
jgi:ribonuclease HI